MTFFLKSLKTALTKREVLLWISLFQSSCRILGLKEVKYAIQFLIVEPGTPYGYSTILKARDYIIQKGTFILASCTHEAKVISKKDKELYREAKKLDWGDSL